MAVHEAFISPRTDTAANFTGNNPTLEVGEFAIESDTLRTKQGDGLTAWIALPYMGQMRELFKSVSVDAPTDADDITIGFTNRALTITQLQAVLRGSGGQSLTWTMRFGPDRDDTGTEVVTGGTTTTSITVGDTILVFDAAAMPADNFMWLETTALAGTVDEFHLTFFTVET